MHTLILHPTWALGDIVCMSALVRDIQRAYPGKYRVLMGGHYRNVAWLNNPHCETAPDGAKGQLVRVEYHSGILKCNNGGPKKHFLSWFHQSFEDATGLRVPVTEAKGDIHLSRAEAKTCPDGRYWVVVAGGKMDMTAKVWATSYWQQTVNLLARQGVRCVQAGGDFNRHFHPKLAGVEQYVGKTKSERDFFALIAGAEGVMCGVTAAMHIAAVFDKPCVVVAGGREAPWWEAYTNCYFPTAFGETCKPVAVEHTFLHTIGLLDCGVGNLERGCWKDKTVPTEQADHVGSKNMFRLCKRPVEVAHQMVPECLRMITPDHVVEAVMNYYEKGVLPPIGKPSGKYTMANGSVMYVDPAGGPVEEIRGLKPPCATSVPADQLDRLIDTSKPDLSFLKSRIVGEATGDATPNQDGTHTVVVQTPPVPPAGTFYVPRVPGPPLDMTLKPLKGWPVPALLDLGPPPKLEQSQFQKEVMGEWADAWPKPFPKQEGESPAFGVMDHPYVGGRFTLFALGHGDELGLMERCLGSILDTCPRHRFDLRVALNQPTPRLLAFVKGLEGSAVTKLYVDNGARRKYPAMREMFWDADCKVQTPYLCWFDDDSWCRKKDWMVLLAKAILASHPHQGRLYGARYVHDLAGVRRPGALREKWFRSAKWWRGRNLYTGSGDRTAPNGSQIVFASGGFWALSTEVMREAGIPDERLNHNGGDITIGCQVTQAGYKVVDFSPRPGKEIIAWSDAPRRGFREDFPWA